MTDLGAFPLWPDTVDAFYADRRDVLKLTHWSRLLTLA
jgi:hypothetical protein